MALSHPTLPFLSNFPHKKSFVSNPPFSLPLRTLTSLNNHPGLILLCSPSSRTSSSEETNASTPYCFEEPTNEATFNKVPIERANDNSIDMGIQSDKAPKESSETEPQNGEAPLEAISSSVQFSSTLDGALAAEPHIEKAPSEAFNAETPVEEVSNEVVSTKESSIATPLDEQTQATELLDGFNLKLENNDPLSVIIYGSGALVALWIFTAIVGAVDSIPLFPKVLEVVGLGFTVWFSIRYLVFKKDRDALSVKINNLKRQIIGSADD